MAWSGPQEFYVRVYITLQHCRPSQQSKNTRLRNPASVEQPRETFAALRELSLRELMCELDSDVEFEACERIEAAGYRSRMGRGLMRSGVLLTAPFSVHTAPEGAVYAQRR